MHLPLVGRSKSPPDPREARSEDKLHDFAWGPLQASPPHPTQSASRMTSTSPSRGGGAIQAAQIRYFARRAESKRSSKIGGIHEPACAERRIVECVFGVGGGGDGRG